MNTTSTITRLLHASTPDSFLGPSTTRYFSFGFKRVDHFIETTTVKDDHLFADLKITWPDCWSKKKGLQLKPHIGTLDFFLFSIRIIETYLTTIELKQISEINKMWASDFKFKAGSQCIESDRFIASCKLLSKNIEDTNMNYLFEISVLGAKIWLKVSALEYNKNETIILNSPSFRKVSYYVAAYKEAERKITDIAIDFQAKLLTANIELNQPDKTTYTGLGNNYMPCVTFCDLVLIGGQLSQIILYETDKTNREEASNLWLRKIHSINKEPIMGSVKIRVEIKKIKTINLKDSFYTCADVIVDFNNGSLIAECNFAYQPFSNEK